MFGPSLTPPPCRRQTNHFMEQSSQTYNTVLTRNEEYAPPPCSNYHPDSTPLLPFIVGQEELDG